MENNKNVFTLKYLHYKYTLTYLDLAYVHFWSHCLAICFEDYMQT